MNARPNVLLVVNHDVSQEWFHCYGRRPVHTPHLDALAREGTLFERHYCQYPLCGPSRASLYTGCRPDTTELYANTTFYGPFRERIGAGSATLPEHLRANGYRTQAVGNPMGVTERATMEDLQGEAHDTPSWSRPRWEPSGPELPEWATRADFRPMAGSLGHYRLSGSWAQIRRRAHVLRSAGKELRANAKRLMGPATEGADVADDAYPTGQLTAGAVRFIDEFAAAGREAQPFFLTIGYDTGHSPWVAPKRYWDLYEPECLPMERTDAYPPAAPPVARNPAYTPAKYYTMDLYDKPWSPSPEQLLELRHAYLACASYFDAQVGALLESLRVNGILDSTLVVVTTDHGFSFGEHGHWHKQTLYEPDQVVPLFVRAPGGRGAGRRVGGFTEHVDLYPSICDLCDVPVPGHLEGASFAALLDDPQRAWKGGTLGQVQRPWNGDRLMGYTLRTERFRYMRWENLDHGRRVDARELYDHRDDADEMTNRAGLPEYAADVETLDATLDRGWRGLLPP